MKKLTIFIVFLVIPSFAFAVPTLQVGAPALPGEGTNDYADYIATLTDPTETDTAVTSGSTLFVSGVYGNNVDRLGGQYSETATTGLVVDGDNWTSFTGPAEEGSLPFPAIFDSAGAIIVASIPNGALVDPSLFTVTLEDVSNLGVDIDYFYSSSAFSFFPNNHDPLKDAVSDFLFFDIGDFLNIADTVPNFDEYDSGYDPNDKKSGEIKEFNLTVLGLDWVHFDVMALETTIDFSYDKDGFIKKTSLTTTIDNNPGSHDLTWKDEGGGGGGQSTPIPEPSTLILLGAGVVGLAIYRRKKN